MDKHERAQPNKEPQPPLALPLRLVDEHGELHETCPNCAELALEVEALEHEKRHWRRKFQNLKADKDAEARASSLWGQAVAIFTEWRIATGHMRSGWSAKRFFEVEPYLKDDGFAMCRAAVWGIAANPNTKRITKDYTEVYDDFGLCFRDRATFERYANRGRAIFGVEMPQDSLLREDDDG